MKQFLLITLLIASYSNISFAKISIHHPEEKVLLIRADGNGSVFIGRDSLDHEGVARYVQERLFKSYLGTGKMHDKIRIQWLDPDVTDAVKESVINSIKSGQKKALTELCLQKFEKLYDSIDAKKQEKLKKQFPVLFQENFEMIPEQSR